MTERTRTYRTHHNGDRPFQVVITTPAEGPGRLAVYRRKYAQAQNDRSLMYEERPCLVRESDQIMVGKSPRTRATLFSGGHGRAFDGNSLLFRGRDGEYIFVGHKIIRFHPRSPIVKFVSPVGNSDVPYPYAVDEHDNIYLLIAGVIITRHGDRLGGEDPYDYYYRTAVISAPSDFHREGPTPPFEAIRLFWVGDDKYAMTYEPNPEKDYDRMVPEMGSALYLTIHGSRTKRRLSKGRYCALIRRFGVSRGFEPFPHEVLGESS